MSRWLVLCLLLLLLLPTLAGAQTYCLPPDGAHEDDPRPLIQTVYAHASDGEGNLQALRPRLETAVRDVQAYLGMQSGWRKTFAMARGNACAPRDLDVVSFPLPLSWSQYVRTNSSELFLQLWEHLQPLTAAAGPRLLLVFVEAPGEIFEIGDQTGVASGITDYSYDSPEAQGGGRIAMIMLDRSLRHSGEIDAEMVAHELVHTLGAVSAAAPNGTTHGHCDQDWDLMCYDDGGVRVAMRDRCRAAAYSTLDCGGDDYFNPTPQPGSWLDTHWNTYRSPFLTACTRKLCPVHGWVHQIPLRIRVDPVRRGRVHLRIWSQDLRGPVQLQLIGPRGQRLLRSGQLRGGRAQLRLRLPPGQWRLQASNPRGQRSLWRRLQIRSGDQR